MKQGSKHGWLFLRTDPLNNARSLNIPGSLLLVSKASEVFPAPVAPGVAEDDRGSVEQGGGQGFYERHDPILVFESAAFCQQINFRIDEELGFSAVQPEA